jgi:hypothetical protein
MEVLRHGGGGPTPPPRRGGVGPVPWRRRSPPPWCRATVEDLEGDEMPAHAEDMPSKSYNSSDPWRATDEMSAHAEEIFTLQQERERRETRGHNSMSIYSARCFLASGLDF